MATDEQPIPPARLTAPVNPVRALYPFGQNLPQYPFLMPRQPATNPISKLDRVPQAHLRRLSGSLPAFSAIQRITNGVLAMPWRIDSPIELRNNAAALKLAGHATHAIKKPNSSLLHDTHRKFVSAIVDDLLTLNYCIVERQPGETPERPFWLWVGNSAQIKPNPQWTEQLEGVVPKFIDYGHPSGDAVGIMAENAFMLQLNVNSYEVMPRSPLEIAYRLIETWLGLSDYQQFTTSRATQEYLLDLGDASADQMKAFREYWDLEVVRGKKMATVAAGGKLKAVKVGASTDEGLYPLYAEYLLKLIALAFHLSGRDSNVSSDDSFATANVSASSTFYYATKPLAQIIDEGFDNEVIDFYLPGFRFVRSYKEPRAEADVNKESREDFISGIISRNEARADRGRDPIEGAEVFINEPSLPAPA